MPKVVRDERLSARVHAFIEQRGSVAAAATAMGVSRTLLWRFDRTGRAIERTRALLAAAVERNEKETVSAENATSVASVPASVSVEELIAMRAFFQNMLNVIDAYVANPSSSAAMAGFARSIASGKGTQHGNMPMMGGQNGQS